MRGNLFSESWFKVAKLRVGLHAAVDVRKQFYRGEPWYVMRSDFGDGYFRITPEAYAFIARLAPERTVEEAWEQCLAEQGESAPTQDEVIQVLAELFSHNLLYFRNTPNAEHAFERSAERKRKKRVSTLFSLMSIKIPLFNPDRLLAALAPLYRLVFSRYGLGLWLLAVFLGVKAAIAEFELIADATQGMLAPGNLFYLYLALIAMKLAHELGHGAATKHLGGSVPTVGVMFIVLTPLPYVDASASWFFQERRERMLVSAAGMIVDLFCASLAAAVWAATGDGAIHSVCFNVMILGSLSSVFFNGNPLIRFDAYYLVADFLEIPNLYERSRKQWAFWTEHYLFKAKGGEPVGQDRRETFWLGAYGIGSFVYRCFLAVVIILIVADKFLLLGVLFFAITAVAGVVLPLWRFGSYLADNRRLDGVRGRAVALSGAAALLAVFLTAVFPMPRVMQAPGVVELSGYGPVYAATEGKLEQVYCRNGDRVVKGQAIARLSNRELELEIEAARARLAQSEAMMRKAHQEAAVDLKPLAKRVSLIWDQLRELQRKQQELLVVAERSGVFVSPDLETFQGKLLKRQSRIGSLVSGGAGRFSAIVSQEQASDLFKIRHVEGRVKLQGGAGRAWRLVEVAVNPYRREELPSAALGWSGGGDVPVSSADRTGKKVSESFYEVSGELAPEKGADGSLVLHGRSGVMRLTLPPEPLFDLACRKVKQTVQKRYQL